MKKLFIFSIMLPQILMAQQEPSLSFTIDFKNDSTGKYNVTLEKHITGKSINSNVKPGTTIKLKDFIKQSFKAAPDTFDVENMHWDFYFTTGIKKYRFNEDEEGWQTLNIINIEDRKSKAKMRIVIPILTNAKWTETYLQNIVFEPNKIIDVTSFGKFYEEDNTVKIILDAKGKTFGKLKSIIQKVKLL